MLGKNWGHLLVIKLTVPRSEGEKNIVNGGHGREAEVDVGNIIHFL